MGEPHAGRVNLPLSPTEIRQIDNYRYAARLPTRPEAIKKLITVSISGELPSDHAKILEIMALFSSMEEKSADNQSSPRTEHVNLTFSNPELVTIDTYRVAARITCRSQAIRALALNALSARFPEEHLSALKKLRTGRAFVKHVSAV
jgi:hypothetical protein